MSSIRKEAEYLKTLNSIRQSATEADAAMVSPTQLLVFNRLYELVLEEGSHE